MQISDIIPLRCTRKDSYMLPMWRTWFSAITVTWKMAHGKLGTDGVQIGEGCRNIKIEPVKRVSSCEMKKQEKCETKKQEKTLYNASDC